MNKLFLFLICIICIISVNCGSVKPNIPQPGHEKSSVAIYRVQVGIFDTQAEANKIAESVRSKTDYRVNVEYKIPFYRVQTGDFVNRSDAEECVNFLKKQGFSDSRYVYINDNPQ
jgi:cell division septation protein DedD